MVYCEFEPFQPRLQCVTVPEPVRDINHVNILQEKWQQPLPHLFAKRNLRMIVGTLNSAMATTCGAQVRSISSLIRLSTFQTA